LKPALIQQALSSILQKDIVVTSSTAVHGGDINKAFRLDTTAGPFFVKQNSKRFKGMFQKEFNGLIALMNTGTLKIPTPYATGDDANDQWLVMEWLEKGPPGDHFWSNFGSHLAQQHKNTSEDFGFNEPNYIGSIIQLNEKCASWKEFYATQRVLPLMMMSLELGRCNRGDVDTAVLVCRKIDSIFPDEPPALLHVDLWSGNFLIHESGHAAIYDPAVYYGHREMDLGMALLFGGFDRIFYDSYNEHYPLEKNWRDRTDLCQLYPLLVHLVLFGGHYYNSVKQILDKYR
jgi:fructosamine-3-kinase